MLVLAGCAALSATNDSEDNGQFQEFRIPDDAIDISTPPEDYSESRVYIHEVRKVTIDGVPKLIVKGSLPESCSRLKSAELNFRSDELAEIKMRSWRPSGDSCLQVLVDFTYVFSDIEDEYITTVTQYEHEGDRGDIKY